MPPAHALYEERSKSLRRLAIAKPRTNNKLQGMTASVLNVCQGTSELLRSFRWRSSLWFELLEMTFVAEVQAMVFKRCAKAIRRDALLDPAQWITAFIPVTGIVAEFAEQRAFT